MINNLDDMIEMRKSCRLSADVLNFVDDIIKPGISTYELDKRIHNFICAAGAYPSPLHYQGFPKSVCTSRNNVMCHGIPRRKEILKNGDIINIDVTTYFPIKNGFHGDTSVTFFIGTPSPSAEHLVKIAFECMCLGIEEVKPGEHIGNIGAAILKHAQKNNFSIAPEFIGHGIGKDFHAKPHVFHDSKINTGIILEEGMIFTIEPIVNAGSPGHKILADGWTTITADGSLSAQFEHTILVTKIGYEILTKRIKKLRNSIL